MDTGHTYDVIVSGLPFASFAPDQVEAITSRYLQLLRPGGVLTYFSYLGVQRAAVLASRTQSIRREAVADVLATVHTRCETSSLKVWANIPPARVWYLRPKGALQPDATAADGVIGDHASETTIE